MHAPRGCSRCVNVKRVVVVVDALLDHLGVARAALGLARRAEPRHLFVAGRTSHLLVNSNVKSKE